MSAIWSEMQLKVTLSYMYYSYFCIDRMLVIRHPDDGQTSGRNMSLKNNSIWLTIYVHLLV